MFLQKVCAHIVHLQQSLIFFCVDWHEKMKSATLSSSSAEQQQKKKNNQEGEDGLIGSSYSRFFFPNSLHFDNRASRILHRSAFLWDVGGGGGTNVEHQNINMRGQL